MKANVKSELKYYTWHRWIYIVYGVNAKVSEILSGKKNGSYVYLSEDCDQKCERTFYMVQNFTRVRYLTVVIAPDDELYPAENGRNKCVSSQDTPSILCRGFIVNLHMLFDFSKLNG